ncbi:MAG TPA: SWIM zinc finger family protein [Rhizomicrobium sp.]|jgi:hypothetical protein|nr:SWIM zinc finger family protein [Rhizomicrobium sp.]
MTKTKDKSAIPRFDLDALREAVGDKVLARGQAYHSDGRVEILGVERNRVRARVAGTEIYQAELTGSGRRFSGACTCPAFEREDFCKHLVATALAANAMDAHTADAVRNYFEQVRDHLRAKGAEALAGMIMGIAERDPDLRRRLELAVAAEGEDDEVLFARFKSAITEASRTSDFIEYRQMRAWAANVEAVLTRLGGLIDKARAPLVMRLLDHFFASMDKALRSVDDSDGHGGGLLARASELHLKACRAAKPEPLTLARDLYRREMEWHSDCFYRASETYRMLLGKTGLAEYRRLAQEAWAQIKPLRGGARRVRDDQPQMRFRLQSILEGFAARDGDIDAWIAIRATDLSSAYAYLQVAKLCADHGRTAEALKWAEEGVWQFEDEPDRRLKAFAAGLRRRFSPNDSPGVRVRTSPKG